MAIKSPPTNRVEEHRCRETNAFELVQQPTRTRIRRPGKIATSTGILTRRGDDCHRVHEGTFARPACHRRFKIFPYGSAKLLLNIVHIHARSYEHSSYKFICGAADVKRMHLSRDLVARPPPVQSVCAILGPIARATMIGIDPDTLLVQPTNSLLRALPHVRSTVNRLSGYPR